MAPHQVLQQPRRNLAEARKGMTVAVLGASTTPVDGQRGIERYSSEIVVGPVEFPA